MWWNIATWETIIILIDLHSNVDDQAGQKRVKAKCSPEIFKILKGIVEKDHTIACVQKIQAFFLVFEFRRDCVDCFANIVQKMQDKHHEHTIVRQMACLDPANMSSDPDLCQERMKWLVELSAICQEVSLLVLMFSEVSPRMYIALTWRLFIVTHNTAVTGFSS